MNEERARELFEWWKESNEDVLNDELYDDEQEKKDREELAQALNIIADILEQNIKTIIVEREFTLEEMNKGLEYCTYKAHRELIKRLLELKLIDIKSMNDIFGKGIVEFRLKVVEPYKRKE